MPNQFDNLDEEELIEILNKGELAEDELGKLIEAMKKKGLKGSIMAVDSPESEEGQAAVEYIEMHKQIDNEHYLKMPEERIEWSKKILFEKGTNINDKKKALLILAHVGRLDVFNALEKYEKNPDPELKIWLNMAIEECQNFLKSDILEEPVIDVSRVTKVGRNDPCPCGAKKSDGTPIKYKHCHGK